MKESWDKAGWLCYYNGADTTRWYLDFVIDHKIPYNEDHRMVRALVIWDNFPVEYTALQHLWLSNYILITGPEEWL